VGTATIAAMVIAPRLTKRLPASIVALATGVGAYFGVALFRPELRHASENPLVIGPLHATGSLLAEAGGRISALTAMGIHELMLIAAPAVTLSVLLSIDTLKTGVILDAMTRRRHDSNRELIAQGVANAASSLAGGMSGSATMGPTLVNVTSGGRTLWSGAIEGVLVLIAFFALRPLMAWVPIAALAGILLVIAWKMFDFQIFKLLFLPSARLDFVVIVAVIIVAEGVGLIQATVVGVFLAVLLFVRNQIQGSAIARKSDLSTVRSNRLRPAEEAELLHAHGSEALFVQLKDDLFFGTTDKLFGDLENDLATRRFILFDFRRVQSMDYTAVHLFLADAGADARCGRAGAVQRHAVEAGHASGHRALHLPARSGRIVGHHAVPIARHRRGVDGRSGAGTGGMAGTPVRAASFSERDSPFCMGWLQKGLRLWQRTCASFRSPRAEGSFRSATSATNCSSFAAAVCMFICRCPAANCTIWRRSAAASSSARWPFSIAPYVRRTPWQRSRRSSMSCRGRNSTPWPRTTSSWPRWCSNAWPAASHSGCV